MRPRFCFLLLGLLCLAACRTQVPRTATQSTPPPSEPTPVLRHADFVTPLAARLSLGAEVAWAKYHSGAPIHDPEREAQILAGVVAQGRERGLDDAFVEKFFAAQFAASRQLQTELIAGWRKGAELPVHAPLDLKTRLRPRLDSLTLELLQTFPATPDAALADRAARTLETSGYSPAVIALATAPLRP